MPRTCPLSTPSTSVQTRMEGGNSPPDRSCTTSHPQEKTLGRSGRKGANLCLLWTGPKAPPSSGQLAPKVPVLTGMGLDKEVETTLQAEPHSGSCSAPQGLGCCLPTVAQGKSQFPTSPVDPQVLIVTSEVQSKRILGTWIL